MEFEAKHASSGTDARIPRFQSAMRVRWVVSGFLLILLTLLVPLIGVAGLFGGFLSGALAGFLTESDRPQPELLLFPLLGYIAFFILPALLCLPLLLPWALFWTAPRRIVVFRRFNISYERRLLRRMVRRSFAPFGHVFTLADKNINISWFVRIPMAIGQLSFLNFRPRLVDGPRGLKGLRRILNQRIWLNINWFLSFRKIFPVRSSDETWQECVQALLGQADLVVVDISIPRDTLTWEITESMAHGLVEQMLFLVSEVNIKESQLWLDEISEKAPKVLNIPVFTYSGSGIDNQSALETYLSTVLDRASAPSNREKYAGLAFRVAGTLGLSVAAAAGGLMLTAPFLFGALTATYSPLEAQVWQAYLYGDARNVALQRLKSDFPLTTTTKLINYAHSSNAFLRDKGFGGLAEIGGAQAIRPLIELGESPLPETQQEATSALRAVMMRVGSAGFPEYLVALKGTQRLPFDIELYKIFENEFLAMKSNEFTAMLGSQSQAVRFTAAVRLSAENDLRCVPVLLEMLRSDRSVTLFGLFTLAKPDADKAKELLEKLKSKGSGKPDPALLEAFLPENDQAAAYAAYFMVYVLTGDELSARIGSLRSEQLRALLPELARLVPEPGATKSARAATALLALKTPWLHSMLQDTNEKLRLDAALILANRGSPLGLNSTIELLSIKEDCVLRSIFRSGPCYKYEDQGFAILDHLAGTVAPGAKLFAQPSNFKQLSIYTFRKLARIFARAGDDTSMRRLLEAYATHNDASLDQGIFWDSASDLANEVPERFTDWIIDKAAAQGNKTKEGKALTHLAEQMISVKRR